MKIGIAAPYDFQSLGGAELYTLNLAHALSREHTVLIFTDQPPIREDGLHFQPLESINKVSLDLGLSQAIFGRLELPAKIRLHLYHGTILGNLKARPWLSIHPSFLRWFRGEIAGLRNRDGILCVSDACRREVLQMGCRTPILKILSGGGFESERYRPRRMQDGRLRVLFCGRAQDKVKRFGRILRAFRKAYKKAPNLILVVAGPADIDDEAGILRLGRMERESALSWARRCEVQINASYYEGSSLSIAEGIFQGGAYSLLSPVGGNLNQIRHQDTGRFFGSEAQLVRYLVELGQRPEIHQRAQESIQSNCPIPSWEQVAKRIVDFAGELNS